MYNIKQLVTDPSTTIIDIRSLLEFEADGLPFNSFSVA
jgi:hypothetical protein